MKRILLVLVVFASLAVQAQDSLSTIARQALQNYKTLKPGKSKFMVRGFFFTGFDAVDVEGTTDFGFIGGGFSPVLLYKQSDRLFFEAELEGEYGGDGFELGLGYANASFILNKYVTVRAGQFLLPFGTFTEKLHPAWINRSVNAPLGFGHDGIAPSSDIGLELRGAFYTGPLKLNYQVYVVNGPQIKDGSIEEDEAGMLKFGYMRDNNKDKTVGGRLGIFPFSNSMMEVGFSTMIGKVGTEGSRYKDVTANLYAVDFSLVKDLNFMKSVVDIKGQYNYSQISSAEYLDFEDSLGGFYSFDNISNGYYAQLTVRPSLIENKFFRNLELVGRYSVLQTPEGALWEQNPTQITVGLNYWLDWRTVIKFGYQTTSGLGDHDSGETLTQDMFYFRWAMGF